MDTKYKIEKGLPVIPQKQAGRKGKYPFKELEVGDSFFVPVENKKEDARIVMRRINPSALTWGIRNGKTITCRIDGNGVRVWRTA